MEVSKHLKDKYSAYFKWVDEEEAGLLIYIKGVEESPYDQTLEYYIQDQSEILTIAFKELRTIRENPVAQIIYHISKMDEAVKKDCPGSLYDFTIILIFKGEVFVFGSGAFPVVCLSHKGIREPIMLYKKKLSELDFPLSRIGSLKEVTEETVLKDRFPYYPPCVLFVTDRDVSHIVRLKDIPVLNKLAAEDCKNRIVGETIVKDKEDIDLIALCA